MSLACILDYMAWHARQTTVLWPGMPEDSVYSAPSGAGTPVASGLACLATVLATTPSPNKLSVTITL